MAAAGNETASTATVTWGLGARATRATFSGGAIIFSSSTTPGIHNIRHNGRKIRAAAGLRAKIACMPGSASKRVRWK